MPKLRPFNPVDFEMEYSTALQRLCMNEIKFGKSEMFLSGIFKRIQEVLGITTKQFYQ